MYTKRLDVDALADTRGTYDGVSAYARTKRGQVVLTELLAERADPRVSFHCMHPGWVDTPALQTSLPRFWRLMRRRLRTPAEGADTIVWLCVAAGLDGESGGFWFDRKRARTHWLPWTRASDDERERLLSACWRWAQLEPPQAP
jgi:hypothetical protein